MSGPENAGKKSVTLGAREQTFLAALVRAGGFATGKEIPGGANRDEDKARQRCRRNGLAVWMKGPRAAFGWQITLAGRLALPPEADIQPEKS